MKSILPLLILFISLGSWANSTQLNLFETKIEELNQQMVQELVSGQLKRISVRRHLMLQAAEIKPLATQIGGRLYARQLMRSFRRNMRLLSKLNSEHRLALEMIYPNGMSGKDLLIKSLNPDLSEALIKIYDKHKHQWAAFFSDEDLQQKALAETLKEVENSPEFDFLFLNKIPWNVTDPVFSFIAEKCTPAFGEEDFFLVLFGFNRCHSPRYQVDRYTVGLGYLNAHNGFSYLTGLKIGRKSFYGVGARVKVGIYYAGGLGVFIGNGLMFMLDLEKTYGLYAGATYINIKPKVDKKILE